MVAPRSESFRPFQHGGQRAPVGAGKLDEAPGRIGPVAPLDAFLPVAGGQLAQCSVFRGRPGPAGFAASHAGNMTFGGPDGQPPWPPSLV